MSSLFQPLSASVRLESRLLSDASLDFYSTFNTIKPLSVTVAHTHTQQVLYRLKTNPENKNAHIVEFIKYDNTRFISCSKRKSISL